MPYLVALFTLHVPQCSPLRSFLFRFRLWLAKATARIPDRISADAHTQWRPLHEHTGASDKLRKSGSRATERSEGPQLQRQLYPAFRPKIASLVLVTALGLTGCAQFSKVGSTAPRQSEDTAPTEAISTKSGFNPLDEELDTANASPLIDGHVALAAWIETIRSARSSIYLKTFIFRPDEVGRLLAEELKVAANRGVEVRILVDDLFHYFKGHDLGLLDETANIELRIYNPLNRHIPPPFNFIIEYDRVNPRMHSKALIVDGSTAIVGGRNVGAEYFRQSRASYFSDFELLVEGDAVSGFEMAFQAYWNDKFSIAYRETVWQRAAPLNVPPRDPEDDAGGAITVSRNATISNGTPSLVSLRSPNLNVPKFSVRGHVKYDPASKLHGKSTEKPYVVGESVLRTIARAKDSVLIVTPYFIPESYGLELLRKLTARGVRVRILTNSLASNNHPSTHAGYRRYRTELLKAGVEIFEYRSNVFFPFAEPTGTGRPTTTLHSKLVLVDERYAIVGSLNFDPRSIRTNSELVFFAESRELAAWIIERYGTVMSDQAYQVTLGNREQLQWTFSDQGQSRIRRSEPTGKFTHGFVALFFGVFVMDSAL